MVCYLNGDRNSGQYAHYFLAWLIIGTGHLNYYLCKIEVCYSDVTVIQMFVIQISTVLDMSVIHILLLRATAYPTNSHFTTDFDLNFLSSIILNDNIM